MCHMHCPCIILVIYRLLSKVNLCCALHTCMTEAFLSSSASPEEDNRAEM